MNSVLTTLPVLCAALTTYFASSCSATAVPTTAPVPAVLASSIFTLLLLLLPLPLCELLSPSLLIHLLPGRGICACVRARVPTRLLPRRHDLHVHGANREDNDRADMIARVCANLPPHRGFRRPLRKSGYQLETGQG